MTADLKVLEKIKKLLALSESQNEHESASALAKAQALMIEHDVTSMQIQLSEIGIGSSDEATGMVITESPVSLGSLRPRRRPYNFGINCCGATARAPRSPGQ